VNARTGEFTPPGITAVARSKSRRDAALPMTGGGEVLDVLATQPV
jgi:hypothetical protein